MKILIPINVTHSIFGGNPEGEIYESKKKKKVSILHQKFVNYSQGRVQPAEGEEEPGKGKALKVEMKQEKRRKRGFLLIPSGKQEVMNVFIF